MAQAARLSLRMQKELKLLLTDPPPHASFPNLSSSSSLSTIHAQIEGPENTVYANGKFQINIQIPDRYPFQPPIVMFDTPIYHPNIDNGGRICLDILNLPPKGAWQPSLNISTVLTSIGLLLSEPNPDDGLMCEASREYKYNRQTFDQKARSMTEKYAKAGCNGSVSGSQRTERIPISDSMEARTDKEPMPEHNRCAAGDTKQHGLNQRLLLDISGLKRKEVCNGPVNVVSDHSQSMHYPENTAEAEKVQNKPERVLAGSDVIAENSRGTKRKLSLSYSAQTSKIHINNEITASKCSSAVLDNEKYLVASSGLSADKADNSFGHQSHQNLDGQVLNERKPDLEELSQNADIRVCLSPSSLSQDANVKDGVPHKSYANKLGINDARRKKLSLGLKNLNQPVATQSKENVAPISYMWLSKSQSPYGKSRMNQKPTSCPLEQLQGSNNEYSNSLSLPQDPSYSSMFPSKQHQCRVSRQQSNNVGNIEEKSNQQEIEDSLLSEAVVVLDSEDSEEESDKSFRPRLLARKGMRNWKSKS